MAYRKTLKNENPEATAPEAKAPWWTKRWSILIEVAVIAVVVLIVWAGDEKDHGPAQQSKHGQESSESGEPITPPTAGPVPSDAVAPVASSLDGEPMQLVSGGDFQMGCVPDDDKCASNERPRHSVHVDPFQVDVHEVTVAAYAQCVQAGVCAVPSTKVKDEFDEFFNWGRPDRENHPVNGVAWYEADAYCRWRDKRLPSEAEFEFLLRAVIPNTRYPWGASDPPASFGNLVDEATKARFPSWEYFDHYNDGYVGTAPVCRFNRDPLGLCDVSGNVFEWVGDWYGETSYADATPGSPVGAKSGGDRVLRGGAWDSYLKSYRSSFRYHEPPVHRSNSVGFRCARTPTH